MFKGIILEGISGTGKTSVFETMSNHPAIQDFPAKSRLFLSEHHTQRVLELDEKAGTLKPNQHVQLLHDLTSFIESLQRRAVQRGWNQEDVKEQDFFYLLERFHLTHVFRFRHMDWAQVQDIDCRMNHLGATLCLLTVNADVLEERLFSRQNPCWLNYLKQYGDTSSQIVDTLIRRQKHALELASRSSLPKIIIDTSHTPVDQVVDALILHYTLSNPRS